MRLSAFILSNMEPILREWEDYARSLGGVTASMPVVDLRDHAKRILEAVAENIEKAQTSAQQEEKSKGHAPARPAHLAPTAATSHGSLRAEEGFSLEQMVSEYRALRASVLRLWAKEVVGGPDAYQQQLRFNEAIDEALADSIRTYSHALDQLNVTKARHRMEALGALSAGLGHDMANVLLPMRSCLESLTLEGLTPPGAPLVEALRQAVEHLGGLAKGLRALATDPDNAAGSADATLLHEWWLSAISPFTWVLPRGVRLHAEGFEGGDKALPAVRVPAHALMQAVFNLVQNAAQAIAKCNAGKPQSTSAGNIWVTAALGPAHPGVAGPGSARVVHLTVRDDGPGMDTETAARCTQAFFTTRARDQGTGLGLYLVRSAVERHGGQLLIESRVGQGTSFTLILPTVDDAG